TPRPRCTNLLNLFGIIAISLYLGMLVIILLAFSHRLSAGTKTVAGGLLVGLLLVLLVCIDDLLHQGMTHHIRR
ncbi:MAG: hypothetical protein RL279_909, partial [Pseudomonadota bacterium]